MEEWRPITITKEGVTYDFTNLYEVSNMGRIRSLDYNHTGRIEVLKPGDANGYSYVNLCKNNRKRTFYVHRIVAEVFIPNPHGYPEVNHIDEDKTNNCVENLEWSTRRKNALHGTCIQRGIKARSKKVLCVETKQVFESIKEATECIGIKNSGDISACCKNPQRTAGGYHWQYVD